ncbi:putative transcription factor interactor and regulator CCHC(Zn) family [Helianthus anomalus]
MMSNVSSSVDAPNNSSDDALNNSINTNVVDEEGTTTLDVHKMMDKRYCTNCGVWGYHDARNCPKNQSLGLNMFFK